MLRTFQMTLVYASSVVCPSSLSVVIVRPLFSKIFAKTAWPPWERGTELYINGPGHMMKKATMPTRFGF